MSVVFRGDGVWVVVVLEVRVGVTLVVVVVYECEYGADTFLYVVMMCVNMVLIRACRQW